MKTKKIITFFHDRKIAKMKIIDNENNIIVKNSKFMENLDFDYHQLKRERNNFTKIDDDGIIGNYYLD